MDFDYLKILVTIILAVLGWIIANYFTKKRDISNKRREVRLNHLISAYLILTHEVTEREVSKERDEKLEKMFSEIQLFGTSKQIDLAKKLIDQICEEDIMVLDPLINNLRDDLRKELELDKLDENVRWLRYKENAKN